MHAEKVKPVIILGAGGHARVLIECLRTRESVILGITDSKRKEGESFCGVDVLGGDEIILEHPIETIYLVNGIGQTQKSTKRLEVSQRMRSFGFRFTTIIHPAATVAADVQMAEGVQIMAGAIIQPGTSIGEDSIINTGTLIDHDCTIGTSCHICPGVTLSGGVRVGDRSMICSGSTVIPNRSIGENAVIAAGSIVFVDIPEGKIFIQRRFNTEANKEL